jgi:hypothetical protein
MFTSEELAQKVVNAANLDQVMIAAFELNKTPTNHQRTDDNVEKERLYVQAELDKGDAILDTAMDLARKAQKQFVKMQSAKNPLVPNEYQILVAAKCMAQQI